MTPYGVSIEWVEPDEPGVPPVAAVVRIHPDGGTFGDPFVWGATLVRRADVGWFKGVCRPLPPGSFRPLLAALYRADIRERAYYRHDGLVTRTIKKPIRPPAPEPTP